MAGIAGVYCADGRPANLAEVKRMTDAAAYFGPDGISYWNAGPVAFAHLQFCTTPESLMERQPLVSPGGEACLVWNGRLDNREEVLAALVAKGAQPVDDTDPGYVLAAYLVWATECIQRLVGDFALVIWDARERKLWCARDYVGVRPFYYFWDGKTFVFGSGMRAVLAHPLVSLKINEGMAGEHLANAITSREETLYSDIRRLPSGSTLTVASGRLCIASWWNPDLSVLQLGTDEEYAEQFLYLMEQSVRSQARCCAPWGVELSGGLDSSTIAVTAQAILNGNGSGERRVSTFSLISPGKPWDESEYISETAQFAGLQTEQFPHLGGADQEHFREWAEWSREFPNYPNGAPMQIPIYEAAKRHGVRVLMSGVGGNEWLDGNRLHVMDLAARLVRTGAVRESLQLSREDWKMYGSQGQWPVFLLRQLISEAVPHELRAFRRKRKLARMGIFSQEFLRRTHLGDRLHAPPERGRFRFTSRDQEAIFHVGFRGQEAHVLELNDRDLARAGVEARYPFFDRRLAEFCVRLPREQRQQGKAWKWVLRNAMRGRLPERVRTKTFQAEFSELYEAVLYDPWARARLENLTMRRQTDWLDPSRLAARIDLLDQPIEANAPPYRPLWMILGIDLWLENLLSSGGSL
jgi:asparagine synthase (glutamine-hydrolysing)